MFSLQSTSIQEQTIHTMGVRPHKFHQVPDFRDLFLSTLTIIVVSDRMLLLGIDHFPQTRREKVGQSNTLRR
jgi:hypothetical protein